MSPVTRLQLIAWIIAGFAPLLQAQYTPSAAATSRRDCAGRMAALLPECNAEEESPVKPPAVRAAPVERPAALPRTPSKPPAPPLPETRDAAGPESPAPPQAATEFQRFAATATGDLLPIFGAALFDRVPTTFAPIDGAPVGEDYVIGPGDELLLHVWGPMNLDLNLTVDRSGAVFVPQAGRVPVAGLRYQQLERVFRAQLERVYRNFEVTVAMGKLRSIEIVALGQVRRPGKYTVSALSTLVNALFASGGPSAQGSMRRVQLKRKGIVVTELDIYDLLLAGDESKDCRLLPGDVVYVPAAGAQVAVAGSIRNPAVYELHGETRVRDLLAMAGGVSAVADAQRGTLERVRSHSALEAVEFRLDAAGLDTAVQDGDIVRILPIAPRFANAVTLRGNVANPGRFPWREGMRLRDIIPDKESLVTRDYWTRRNALALAPREATPPPGEVERKLAKNNVEAIPDINWSYAVIERQNPHDLKSELIPFHPGKLLLEGDESQNLPLGAGDVVTLFSQADVRVAMSQQTRFIRLEGEFRSAGVYAVRPGETLGQLIERAGGFTPQAYLYGAELLRDSTRVDQQRRLDEFTRDLEAEVEHTAAIRMGGAASADETAALAARLETQRRFVDRLRQVHATGRIVLNFEPADTSNTKLMEVALEDGDRFIVPARPATVNVLGAVYNQNSFLHEAALRSVDYLRHAGGPTRNADMGHSFIIRADGRIVPRQGTHAFDALRLSPGDSLVIPEQIMKGSLMRGLRDWTQVFSQLALGAAAINVLR